MANKWLEHPERKKMAAAEHKDAIKEAETEVKACEEALAAAKAHLAELKK